MIDSIKMFCQKRVFNRVNSMSICFDSLLHTYEGEGQTSKRGCTISETINTLPPQTQRRFFGSGTKGYYISHMGARASVAIWYGAADDIVLMMNDINCAIYPQILLKKKRNVLNGAWVNHTLAQAETNNHVFKLDPSLGSPAIAEQVAGQHARPILAIGRTS